ncbi:MAG: hypothetical protein EXS13_11370 [Planctomycetes bacterium]|nr:hypothetical protein [Planctomycetota bacterium]
MLQSVLPLVARCGANAIARLVRHGFFPAGSGVIEVDIEPATTTRPFELLECGALRQRSAVALFSNLSRTIAATECNQLRRSLGWRPDECQAVGVEAHGPGNALLFTLEHEQLVAVSSAAR